VYECSGHYLLGSNTAKQSEQNLALKQTELDQMSSRCAEYQRALREWAQKTEEDRVRARGNRIGFKVALTTPSERSCSMSNCVYVTTISSPNVPLWRRRSKRTKMLFASHTGVCVFVCYSLRVPPDADRVQASGSGGAASHRAGGAADQPDRPLYDQTDPLWFCD
jgi:hypothetical protein